jgi:hypothetical protein
VRVPLALINVSAPGLLLFRKDFAVFTFQQKKSSNLSFTLCCFVDSVTKHDLKVASARNARNLVENMTRSGDLSKTNVGISNKVSAAFVMLSI